MRDRTSRVWVERTTRVGNAMREPIATRAFRLDDNRQSEAIESLSNAVEGIQEATENRLVSATFVEDMEIGERLFP